MTRARSTRLLAVLIATWAVLALSPLVLNAKNGLHAEYFENTTRSGTPTLSVLDPEISRSQVTAHRVVAPGDAFSARWFGYVTIDEPRQYTFGTSSDDGSWLTIDGRLVVDNGGKHGAITRSGTIALDRGPHFILLEFDQLGGDYTIGLLWGPDAEHLAPLPAWRLSPTRVEALKIPIARRLDWLARVAFILCVLWGAWTIAVHGRGPIAAMVGDCLASNDLAFATFASFGLFLVLYPGLVFLTQTPMGGTTWELQDPVVSVMTFVPGLRVIRYELLEHGNLLWSSLRNAGAPIPGNEVQAAPMFPLTLLFIWLPDWCFWNVLVVSRVLLSGIFAILIARQVLGFGRFASAVFCLTLVCSVYVCEWMNHPWQNGFLAGLAYLFFVARLADASRLAWGWPRFGAVLGCAVAVYSMVTAGFPEASAMSALLVFLVLSPPLARCLWRGDIRAAPFALGLVLAHGVGMAVASPQLFSLTEYIEQYGGNFKAGIGVMQFQSVLPFGSTLMTFREGPPENAPIRHIFNLAPLFLFLLGLLSIAFAQRRRSSFDLSAAIAGAFYVVKCFPVWPAFNHLVGALPVLSQSWFTVYFFSIFLWFFAYYCARGADWLVLIVSEADAPVRAALATWPLAFLTVLLVVYAASLQLGALDREVITGALAAYAAVGVVMAVAFVLRRSSSARWALPLIFALIVWEAKWARPADFLTIKSPLYSSRFERHQGAGDIRRVLKHQNVAVQEVRERSQFGDFIEGGVASFDNGASAILTARAQLLRITLFKADWSGYMPIADVRVPNAWNLSGASFMLADKASAAVAPPYWRPLGAVGDRLLVRDARGPGRAFRAGHCFVAGDMAQAAEVLKGHDFQLGDVVLDSVGPQQADFCKTLAGVAEPVAIVRDRGAALTLNEVIGPAVVVLNDSYYPGWKVDDQLRGERLELVPANINFRGILLREARHYRLGFIYEPAWLGLMRGLILSALAMIVGMGVLAVRSSRTRIEALPEEKGAHR